MKKLRLTNNNTSSSSNFKVFNIYSPYSSLTYKPHFKALEPYNISIETFDKEGEVNGDITIVAKSLLQMCKSVKESLSHLRCNDLGRAKFSLISREWEFAEMDFEKHSNKLSAIHGVDMYKGKKLEEFKLKKGDTGRNLKFVKSSVEKVLGNDDPFEGVMDSVTTKQAGIAA